MSTPSASVISVNVGSVQTRDWAKVGATAIDKRPVSGRVEVGELGLAGDGTGDTRYHGGAHQAVYAYAREDLDFWVEQLEREVDPGQFGENLTTTGIDLNELEVGTRLRVGGGDGVLLEVSSVRTPCNDFKAWMGVAGYDPMGWVRRFTLAARPGPYLRVLEGGTIGVGDSLDVVHRPGHGITVRTMFAALNTDRTLLPRLLEIDVLPPNVRQKVDRFVLETGMLPRG